MVGEPGDGASSSGGRSRRPAPVTVVSLLLWAALATVAVARLAGHSHDDFFITYRYAANLARGDGFVFNPGERVFGLTNPGLGLLLGVVAAATRIPPHLAGTGIYGAALLALALVLWDEARRRGSAADLWPGLTLMVASSYVWTNHGSASTTVLLLLALAATLAPERPGLAGGLAGLAVWFRPDAALGVAVLAGLRWMETRRLPWRFVAVAAAVVGAGLLAAWLYFGSPLPNTLHAKRVMAAARPESWSGPTRFWARATPLLPRHLGAGWLLVVGGGVAGIWPLWQRAGRATRTIVAYGVAVAVAYPLLDVPFYAWYTVPPLIVALLGLGALGVSAGREVAALVDRRRRTVAAAAAALLLAVPVASAVPASYRWLRSFDGQGRFEVYRRAAEWIRDNTPADSRVAFGEIGYLGYYGDRHLDDLMGLVTPRVLPYVAAGDDEGAFLALAPDVFLTHPAGPHAAVATLPWFADAYRRVARIRPDRPRDATVTIYQRRPGSPLPSR